MSKVSNREARGFIIHRQEFESHTGNFYGLKYESFVPVTGWFTGNVGHLPEQYHESIRGAEYVVYSYSTPIAWFKKGEWFIPPVAYSFTTSARHQSQLYGFSEPESDWADEFVGELSVYVDHRWNDTHKTFQLLLHWDSQGADNAICRRTKSGWMITDHVGRKARVPFNVDYFDESHEAFRRAVKRALFTAGLN